MSCLRPPFLNPRTGGSGYAQCSTDGPTDQRQTATSRYDVKPARFALNQAAESFAEEVLPVLV